ncbi:hypothetical protein TTRE_0000208501 [Trichuris trichiura]|uniref:Uncharacterized protein n=1 Tax=Trichuris trichiura TaxID=36087 RepID=A0A077Z275_TRITR|nr:hypothetical protein TTRE_0000208501 [Trichuris trichiura]
MENSNTTKFVPLTHSAAEGDAKKSSTVNSNASAAPSQGITGEWEYLEGEQRLVFINDLPYYDDEFSTTLPMVRAHFSCSPEGDGLTQFNLKHLTDLVCYLEKLYGEDDSSELSS